MVSFPAGTTIVEEGMLGETMFVVTSGEAKVTAGEPASGHGAAGRFLRRGGRCSTARRGAHPSWPRPRCVAIRLFRRTLLKMLEAEPQLSLKILDSLVRRVRDPLGDLAQRLARQQSFDLGERRRVQLDVARRRRCRGCDPRSGCRRSPTVTPGWATFQASASCAIEMPRRSAIGRSPSTTRQVVVELLVGERAVLVGPPPVRRPIVRSFARVSCPVRKPNAERARTSRRRCRAPRTTGSGRGRRAPASRTPAGANPRDGSPRSARCSARSKFETPMAAHRAGVLELGHGTPGVLDRHARLVGPMQLVQVDHVDAQASERGLASRADLLRTEPRALGRRGELRSPRGPGPVAPPARAPTIPSETPLP